jgi:porin
MKEQMLPFAAVVLSLGWSVSGRAESLLSLDANDLYSPHVAGTSVVTLDTTTAAAPAAAAAAAEPALVTPIDYSGDIWQSPALTGNWGGTRQQLMNKGIRFDASLTQVYQQVTSGGKNYTATYEGNVDVALRLDTGKMGLWPGGMFVVHAEGRYGNSALGYTGSLVPVNNEAIYPAGNKDVIAIPELNYTQFLCDWAGVAVGKFMPVDDNVFASDSSSQFLNSAFNFDPVVGTTMPLSGLGAAVVVLPAPWLMVTTMAMDTEGRADTAGFDTVFNPGTSFLQLWEFTVKPFGQVGHQRVTGIYSNKDRTLLTQTPRDIFGAIITGGGVGALSKASNDWCAYYDFDQYVYTIDAAKNRGFGFFGRVGFGDGNVNPVQEFYSGGIGGKGVIPSRENDTFGIGYYYMGISDQLQPILARRVRDEQGVELFYNFALTNWMHLSPDLQVISPTQGHVDTTCVIGVRLKIDF